jgi:hypothetical protein
MIGDSDHEKGSNVRADRRVCSAAGLIGADPVEKIFRLILRNCTSEFTRPLKKRNIEQKDIFNEGNRRQIEIMAKILLALP